MTKACKVTEMMVTTEDCAGALGRVTTPLKAAGVNIDAFCAYGMDGKGHCMFVCSETDKAMECLKKAGFDVKTRGAVMVNTDNCPGKVCEISCQLGEAGINIDYCYATTSKGDTCNAIFCTEDDDKVMKTLGC